MISLLEEKWLPVRRRSGQLDWVAPHQIVEPDIVGFAASRADFNGALAQMMIGWLQTSTPLTTDGAWEDALDAPPSPAELQRWFAPHADAFVLDGDKARFMQDFSLAEGVETTIDALLIDAPGSSTIDKNTDHFVKRGTVGAMCPHCAAIALFTLQTNAPAGGAGNRTSLRGGGPLTTLVVAAKPISLWHDLWLNVKPQRAFLQHGGDARKTDRHFTFPWLADITKIQAGGGETQPVQVHPHHVFWAMPRRIRLDFADVKTGNCDICKRASTQLLHRYISRPQGLNYKGPWRHPFSPYYETKEGWLPVHPQPGGFSYKNWLGWVFGSEQNKKKVQAASVVGHALAGTRELSLWMFGYDLDNMKARCWYETTFPLYALGAARPAARENLQGLVKNMIEASEQAVFYTRQAVKQAWFGEADMRGDLSFIDKAFWDSTEPLFYKQLLKWVELAKQDGGIDMDDSKLLEEYGTAWLNALRSAGMRLFDADIVGASSFSQQDPRRIAEAHNQLKRNFDGKAIRTILRLPLPEQEEKASKAGARKKQSLVEPQAHSNV
ncbi:type I-E CRISPR-associated protein Cse1/CasA [Janthinobacterium agaricidamnosum]|uniref:CRISPR-associated Cse1 family protein n=1 Tax=Janthinobacterium agaricidamnosum NBRC 102515 = DSM 9628 TaxID=1349767 RepID=W0V950_9BURK|nr:type I-E CRISPR-associated protein Cse1/CasA [Janthinobacterium agaricidamnosum]CDG83802.1 CRISPR-associated Cse1 family protein [Janthinobacterium agaricidamnosum NBRC 102515 = DSM 9628]